MSIVSSDGNLACTSGPPQRGDTAVLLDGNVTGSSGAQMSGHTEGSSNAADKKIDNTILYVKSVKRKRPMSLASSRASPRTESTSTASVATVSVACAELDACAVADTDAASPPRIWKSTATGVHFIPATTRPIATALTWSTVDSAYQSAVTRGRDAVFTRLSRDESSRVLGFLGKASGAIGARGREPLLHLSIDATSRLVQVPPRAVTALGDCLAATFAAARSSRCVAHAWIPIVLTAGSERHSNAFLVDIAARTIYLFEPHGSDPTDKGHAGTNFANFYNAPQYYSKVETLVQGALVDADDKLAAAAISAARTTGRRRNAAASEAAHDVGATAAISAAGDDTDAMPWRLVVPTDYEPPVFGQSCTRLPASIIDDSPVGKGDPWCALWTLRFLLEATVEGVVPWVESIAKLTPDALGLRVISWVHAQYI